MRCSVSVDQMLTGLGSSFWSTTNGARLRNFGYVRRKDGGDITDGEYDVREGEDERRRKWKNGMGSGK